MDHFIDLNTTVVASTDQVSGELQEGDLAILNLKDGVYYGLNSVGSRIWALLQAPVTVMELRDALLAEYDVDVDDCTRELVALLNDLSNKELIEVHAAGA
ncbi:MAG: PqqD family peptide modification chaperone [Anaerolineales bacterium]|jgi:hypothetical protein